MVVNVCQLNHGKHDIKIAETSLGEMWVYDVEKYNMHSGYYCTGQDAVSGSLIAQGSWEDIDTKVIKKILFDGSRQNTVIDFGCHIGWYSLMAAQMGYQVISIDGDEENLELLQKNADRLGVGAYITPVHAWVDENLKQIEYLGKNIELIKIDLEGKDPEAIRVVEKILPYTKNLYVEISPVFNDRYPEMVNYLIEQGFKAFYPDNTPFDDDYSLSQINLRFSR